MLSDSMNIPHSEVSTFINQYYLYTNLSIYYYGYVHVMCFYCSEGNTGNGGRPRHLFFYQAITRVTSQIAFLRWYNVGSTLYTTMAHGWHTTLDQGSFALWRMVG